MKSEHPVSRKLDKATSKVPKDQRAEFSEEWRSNISYRDNVNIAEEQIVDAASSMSRRIRFQRVGYALAGRLGKKSLLLSWLPIVVLVLATQAFGGFPMLVLLVFAIFGITALIFAGTPTHLNFYTMVVSLIATCILFFYFGTSFNAGVNAADNFQEMPKWAQYTWPAFFLSIAFGALFLSAIVWDVWSKISKSSY